MFNSWEDAPNRLHPVNWNACKKLLRRPTREKTYHFDRFAQGNDNINLILVTVMTNPELIEISYQEQLEAELFYAQMSFKRYLEGGFIIGIPIWILLCVSCLFQPYFWILWSAFYTWILIDTLRDYKNLLEQIFPSKM